MPPVDVADMHAEGYQISVLGPVTGRRDEEKLDFGPPRQRAVLSMLAIQAGRTVSRDQLIDGVWGEKAPVTAEQSVYTYVAGLRRALEPSRTQRGPSRLLVSMSGGYVLRLEQNQVDAVLFERYVDQAGELRDERAYEASLLTLTKALSLWQGQAMSGVPGPFAERARRRLSDLRLTSLELRADILLLLGRHQGAVTDLWNLVHDNPLRERPRELLMLALYRCGRRADALSVFDEARRLLVEELGVDPGESLRRCHEQILRADPALDLPSSWVTAASGPGETMPAPVPRQLPRRVLSFVGRAAELVRLRSLLAPWDGSPPQPVVVIIGAPGAGKSALAIEAAHAVSEHFPDGQLYVNLHGATPGVKPLEPHEMLSRFLRALLVPAEAVPSDIDEAAALLRERLAARRVLIVMDNAAALDQVRPVLSVPQGNAILLTSRESFAVADNCAQLRLGTMPHFEAVTMLAKLVGAERVAANPAATTQLVHLCGGLPLALRLAAARLVDRPGWKVTDLVARLRDERQVLHELESGDIAVRASFRLSYDLLSRSDRPLDRAAAKALRRLGLLHVPDVTADVVAALLDIEVDLAGRALERLVDAHMAESGTYGRFQLHDLVRRFAFELSEEHETPDARWAALNRALGLYTATTRLAVRLLDPHRVQPPGPEVEPKPCPLADGSEAHEWLEKERPNLLAAASQAMTSVSEPTARQGVALCFSLWWYLHHEGRRRDNMAIHQQALHAGKRLNDLHIQARAHGNIAGPLHQMGQSAEAAAHQETELALQRGLGDRFAEMRALGNLSVVYVHLERYEDALRCAEEQLAISREIGSNVGERHALFMAGRASRGLGDLTAATAALKYALVQARDAGDNYQASECLVAIAEICLDQNEPLPAKIHLEDALDRARTIKYHAIKPKCLCYLARALRLLDELDNALSCVKDAIAIARTVDDKRWGEIAAKEQSAIYAAFAKSLKPPSQRG
ncbi:winged helix-turn-helix domain-containing protein [Planotetraspora sp. A-T 1434]|uniref:AfsR/SARP family transcriptional regulator n=1 Tax=Planotetraspora sp. A-T 1434 TaxID=2979219 RepID=UPI0021BE80E7|nr:BTAD domain-containing putative transcriptional regulator [Planotetraspora sp. A-T 1434]MCT9930012.1 winged helix-turn-helix domain-containing protein [Planotetraspora sp. A-T 1434]